MVTLLPNNCRIGTLSVHPKNWEAGDADLSIEWYIHYRFHHPHGKELFPKGYLVKIRGMNDKKTLRERQRETRRMLDDELKALKNGDDPVPERFGLALAETNGQEILPHTPFVAALEKAYAALDCGKAKKEVKKALVHITVAVRQLHYDRLTIGEVRRRHVKAVLDKIATNKKEAAGREWGPSSYNHYRAYLGMLFDQLEEMEATEIDPVAKIKKKRTTKKDRLILTDEELQVVYEHVRDRHYTLWRIIHLFFQSGARMSEIMQVRRRDVNLRAGKFKVTVRKGSGEIEEVWKTITTGAYPIWEELVHEGRLNKHGQRGRSGSEVSCLLPSPAGADPDDFLFSYELRPGSTPISERQLTERWLKHVKKPLGIQAHFYSLKKKFTTEVVTAALEEIEAAHQVAADHNNHKGTAMVKKHYDGENQERLHRKLRVV